jgi:hypothetical protein
MNLSFNAFVSGKSSLVGDAASRVRSKVVWE